MSEIVNRVIAIATSLLGRRRMSWSGTITHSTYPDRCRVLLRSCMALCVRGRAIYTSADSSDGQRTLTVRDDGWIGRAVFHDYGDLLSTHGGVALRGRSKVDEIRTPHLMEPSPNMFFVGRIIGIFHFRHRVVFVWPPRTSHSQPWLSPLTLCPYTGTVLPTGRIQAQSVLQAVYRHSPSYRPVMTTIQGDQESESAYRDPDVITVSVSRRRLRWLLVVVVFAASGRASYWWRVLNE